MKQFVFPSRLILLFVFFIAIIPSFSYTNKNETEKILYEHKQALSLFATDVYKIALKRYKGNFVINHLLLNSVFSLITNGARGKTYEELSKALRLSKGVESIQGCILLIRNTLRTLLTKDFNYKVASRVFVHNDFPIKDQFTAYSKNFYNTDVTKVDMGNSEGPINDWISKNTHNGLKNLFAPVNAGPSSIVAINTMDFSRVYPKGASSLKKPFKPDANKPSIDVDVIKLTCYCPYYEDGVIAVALEYGTPGMSLVVWLNSNDVYLPKYYYPNFTTSKLVEVIIPKFKIETNINFIEFLKELGVVNAFNNDADFSGITDKKKLKIHTVLDSTYLEIADVSYFKLQSIEDKKPDVKVHFQGPFPFALRWEIEAAKVNFLIGKYSSPENPV